MQVLRLHGCRGLGSRQGIAAITSMMVHGELRSLELSGGGQLAWDASVLKGVLKQRELHSLSVTSCRCCLLYHYFSVRACHECKVPNASCMFQKVSSMLSAQHQLHRGKHALPWIAFVTQAPSQ